VGDGKPIIIPYSCCDCETIVVRSENSRSTKCSKCKKKLVMFGTYVEDFWSKHFRYCVMMWGVKEFEIGAFAILNENYHCPRCKEMSLRFEITEMWD
jgi:ribosomal protein L37AE/L43A